MPTTSLLLVAAMAATAQATADPHSCAETDRFIVRDVALDLRADFEARRLDRSAELTVEQIDPHADEFDLDTRDLEIRSVHLIEASGREKVLAFQLGERDPVLDSKLAIRFPHCCAATPQMRIRIEYCTSPEASAWPDLTGGIATTSWSCPAASRTAAWKIRGSRSSRRPSSPATAAWSRSSCTSSLPRAAPG